MPIQYTQSPVRTGKVHTLKSDPVPFAAMRCRALQSNCRLNDRDYQLGDMIVFQEYVDERLTGEAHEVGPITSIVSGDEHGVKTDYVIVGWLVSVGVLESEVKKI